MRQNTKHVQTELGVEEYERLRTLAQDRDLTVKDATREALVDWIERRQPVDPDDAAFDVLDELDGGGDDRTDAASMGDLPDDWSGEDVSISLTDDPGR